ncbi:nitrous oxide reductase family maturation protein NosD, partial [Chloroflexota bacterium]
RLGAPQDRLWGRYGETAALTLDHVKGAVIEGNVIQNIQLVAMTLHDVSDSVITNNTITPLQQVTPGSPVFLTMHDSPNNTITDNYITGVATGIWMNNHSTGNYVAGNEITPFRAGHLGMGITLEGDSNNNIFTDNIILGPSGCTAFRIFTQNNVITNNTIRDMIYGIVIAGGADGNIVANNNLSQIHVRDAILLYRSNGNHVINNNISSSVRGISVSRFSRNNVVQANTISNSRQGILINSSSDNNLIANNKVSRNKVGIMVYKSSENKMYDNSFIGNSQQGYDDGVNNWNWENRGNYWSDYKGKGDTAYDIAPAGIDEHPLTESMPIVPVEVPEPAPLSFREVYQAPVLRIKDEVKYEDREILMENCYHIENGGKLILENVTLRSVKDAAIPYLIRVGAGGSLVISNSKIIAPETGIAPISIEARPGSTLVIKDSEFHNVDSGMRDGGPLGNAITILCEGAVVEGNIITGCRTGVGLYEEQGGKSARIVNNTFEGCLEDVEVGNPWAGHVIEGNISIDPVPAEKRSSIYTRIAAMGYRMLLYWMRDPRVIAGISVIGIGAIALGVLLFRRRHRRKARATGTG